MRTQRILRVFCTGILVAWTSGCGEQLGGGSRGIAAGATVKTSVYGIRKGKELAFVIFTDLSSAGTKTSGGSAWTGKIQPSTGPSVEYEGEADGLAINGTRYDFASGRVFLVTATGGTVSAQQLSIPIGSSRYDMEIDSISKRKEIQDFLIP
jgi:hypothetical protein